MNKENNIVYLKTKNSKILKCYESEQMHKPIYYPVNNKINGYVDWNNVEKIFNIDNLYNEYHNLQQRIDKVIEYCEHNIFKLMQPEDVVTIIEADLKKVISILKGENNE